MKKLVMFLAVAGVLASCKPEAIETAFDVNPAEANITVTVLDIDTAQPAEGYTLTADAGTVDGNVVTVKGNKALAETAVTITANFKGTDYPTTVTVNAMRAGAKASYAATIVVGTPVSDKVITYFEDVDNAQLLYEEYAYLTPDANGHYGHSVDHNFTHDGISNWVQNLTEFMLNLTVTYNDMFGIVYDAETAECLDPNYKSIVDSYASLLELGSFVQQDENEYECQVSAWSYYTVKQTIQYFTYNTYVLADDEPVGVIPAVGVQNYVEKIEIANPYGHGHYEQGHGSHDGHGNYPNAGGGIVYGE